MSTNSECLFVQVKPNQWYYVLEDSGAPKNAWDWREYATAYGPFESKDDANEHLSDNHANPGGSCTEPLEDGQQFRDLDQDSVLKNLIATAQSPYRRRFGFF